MYAEKKQKSDVSLIQSNLGKAERKKTVSLQAEQYWILSKKKIGMLRDFDGILRTFLRNFRKCI